MNPQLPLQIHLKIICKENNLFDIESISKILQYWNEDYLLAHGILLDKVCKNCDDTIHWIHKLNCPQKVYSEAHKFKNLYYSLQKVVDLAKYNREFIYFLESYIPQIENKNAFELWAIKVMKHPSNIDDLRFELFNNEFFITNEAKELIKINPLNFISDKFEFELFIKPELFSGLFKLLNLIESYLVKSY